MLGLLILNFFYMYGVQEELDKNQIQLLKNAFDAFDREKKGVIGTDMIGTILEMLGHELDEDTLKEIIDEVDQDGSGELEFGEFCSLAAKFLTEEDEDDEAMVRELREAFRLYDKEGNGYITTDVLKEIFRELDNTLNSEELDTMIEEIDSDGSGTVDFDGVKPEHNWSIKCIIKRNPWHKIKLVILDNEMQVYKTLSRIQETIVWARRHRTAERKHTRYSFSNALLEKTIDRLEKRKNYVNASDKPDKPDINHDNDPPDFPENPNHLRDGENVVITPPNCPPGQEATSDGQCRDVW
ncbi:unnamed protein product [Diatraea saccharalis]|uniref:EF-hand domain-containing protein n=1 Tax=Diatraea saccharalis TaxID=40085 RepID=A0A9N9QV00_9NEOP|nr:unnamed protein product [Diatraea saccharalis]